MLSIAVCTPENLGTSLKVSTVIISFDMCESVRRHQKFGSIKINGTVAIQTDLIF